ncbi:MAG: SDR family NAD(P)-dependent oxidoreductase, partial [Actinomycetota bacterium]
MSKHPLGDKVALVTGSGRGIGAAIASRLAELGAITVLCGRTQSHIDQTAARIAAAGGRAQAIACDVSNWTSVAALAAIVQQSLGRLDILVNNAGIGGFGGPLHAMPIEKWDAVLNTNL